MSGKILLTGNFLEGYTKELSSKIGMNVVAWKYVPSVDMQFELVPIDDEVVGIIVFHPLELAHLGYLDIYRRNWGDVLDKYCALDKKPWIYVLSGFKDFGIYDVEDYDIAGYQLEFCYIVSNYVPKLLNIVAKDVVEKLDPEIVANCKGFNEDHLCDAETNISRSLIESIQLINGKLKMGGVIVVDIMEEKMDNVIDDVVDCFRFSGYRCVVNDRILTLSLC